MKWVRCDCRPVEADRQQGTGWLFMHPLTPLSYLISHVTCMQICRLVSACTACPAPKTRITAFILAFHLSSSSYSFKVLEDESQGHHFILCLFSWISHSVIFFYRLLKVSFVACDIGYHLCVKIFHLNSVNACFSLASACGHLLGKAVIWDCSSSCVFPTSAFREYWSGLILTHWDNFVAQLFGCSLHD